MDGGRVNGLGDGHGGTGSDTVGVNAHGGPRDGKTASRMGLLVVLIASGAALLVIGSHDHI
jgi:hypothetical protein